MINLKRKYNLLNKQYFGGKLPKDIELEWSERMPMTVVGGAHPHGVIECEEEWCRVGCDRCWIRLDPQLKDIDAFAEMTLLHEMVHIKATLGNRNLAFHGRDFNTEMLRLAKAGAFHGIW